MKSILVCLLLSSTVFAQDVVLRCESEQYGKGVVTLLGDDSPLHGVASYLYTSTKLACPENFAILAKMKEPFPCVGFWRRNDMSRVDIEFKEGKTTATLHLSRVHGSKKVVLDCY